MSGRGASRLTRLSRLLGIAAAVLLLEPAAAVPVGAAPAPIPSGVARIWFYRDYDIYVNRNYATVMVNGAVAGSVDPYGGVLYRDVPPGHYHLGVESYGIDVGQDADIDLAAGQEAFIKILNLPSWASDSGAFRSFSRDTYYLRPIPPDIARAEMARRPL